jgi:hypothetical protein
MTDYLVAWMQHHRDHGHDPYTYVLNGQTWAACRTCFAGTTTVTYPFYRHQADGGVSADQFEGGPDPQSRHQADGGK